MAAIGEDLLAGLTIPELITMRREAQDELFKGVIQSVSGGDTTTTIFGKMAPESRIRLINKVLTQRDPKTFPANQPVRRTQAFYS